MKDLDINIIQKIENLQDILFPEDIGYLHIQSYKYSLEDRFFNFIDEIREKGLGEYLKYKKKLKEFRKDTRAIDYFDPNSYFLILKNIQLKAGYTLDFVYEYFYSSGSPKVYVRKVEEKPFKSVEEYRSWAKTNKVSDYLICDKSDDSYFQLAVFLLLYENFFLYWHSQYEKIKVVLDANEILKLCEKYYIYIENDLSNVMPSVYREKNIIKVSFCLFKEYKGGVFRRTITIEDARDLQILNVSEENIIKYQNTSLL